MTLRLGRLNRGTAYFDKDGRPTTQMQLLWQQTMERIEAAVNGLQEALDAASTVQPASALKAFTATSGGTIDPSAQLPATVAFKRYRDGVDVSASATWTIQSQGGITGGTVTVSAGTVTIPAGVTVPPTTAVTVRSVYNGVTIDTPLTVTRTDAAAPATGSGGGTSVNDTTFGSVSGTSMTTISDTMTVKTGSGGNIALALNLESIAAAAANDGIFEVELQWRWRPIAGSWTNVTAVLSSPSATVETESGFYYSTNGYVIASQSVTGLTATTDYEVEVQARRTGSSPAKTVSFSGTVTATGS